ncbi:MAG: flavodoxin domain-containing protein [Deltaproteobacteria bacterium]|nr:flavodoxin domain-containing protein [Deltaproteobacteria bacterium]
MARVLIVYHTRTGNTKKMAELIREGISGGGVDVEMKNIEDTVPDDLLEYEGILFGCPTYYGVMPAVFKELVDKSIIFHGRLAGKVGGAFASSANVGGGNETTILSVLHALLIHGMIIQGDASGDHYGPVSIGAPDERARQECARFGRRFAELVKRLYP